MAKCGKCCEGKWGNVFIKRAWPARFTICELRNELLSFRVATVSFPLALYHSLALSVFVLRVFGQLIKLVFVFVRSISAAIKVDYLESAANVNRLSSSSKSGPFGPGTREPNPVLATVPCCLVAHRFIVKLH